jgi:hypothetical protein
MAYCGRTYAYLRHCKSYAKDGAHASPTLNLDNNFMLIDYASCCLRVNITLLLLLPDHDRPCNEIMQSPPFFVGMN